MFRPIDIARPQVADQQLIATKDIQGKKTVVVIIAMEKASFLFTMNGIIRRIEIQDQFIGRSVKGGDELIDQNPVYIDRCLSARSTLEPTEGLAAQFLFPVDRGLQRRVLWSLRSS